MRSSSASAPAPRWSAKAGLLDGKRATTHWYSLKELRDKHPTIHYVADRRLVVDRGVATTTGITASMPMALTLIEAIAGRDKAEAVARDLGLTHWDARHDSEAFQFTRPFALTAIGNTLAFWNREQLGIALAPGVDEVSLALVADAWSRTYRSRAVTFAGTAGAQQTRNGIRIVPDQVAASWPAERLLPAIGDSPSSRQQPWTRPFTASRPATACAPPTSSPCSSNTRGKGHRNEETAREDTGWCGGCRPGSANSLRAFARCVQLLACDDPRRLPQWVGPWEARIAMPAGDGKGADAAAGHFLSLLCNCGEACPLPCRL